MPDPTEERIPILLTREELASVLRAITAVAADHRLWSEIVWRKEQADLLHGASVAIAEQLRESGVER